MSSVSKFVIILVAAFALAACENPQRYPVSGEECGAEDPVLDVDASMADCMPNI
ncbi:hypothetical protein [Roseovarius aestuarii]|uniref:Lipoprotein n=1 Tax=Roseovarius aestuarii TaxID=475083 RepID=A0A1X7BR78_9RHOB|nr:hypothetical protein [Roseovarius aestuarii]SMC12186.1 hypothetical protein ROA7745_02009 [Roseovarius aestuarii]